MHYNLKIKKLYTQFQKQQEEGRLCLGSRPESAVHSGEGMVTGWSHCSGIRCGINACPFSPFHTSYLSHPGLPDELVLL